MDKRVATSGNLWILSLLLVSISLPFINPYLVIASFVLMFIFLRSLLLRLIFIGPGNRKPTLEDENYRTEFLQDESKKICYHYFLQKEKSDLVIFLHGWQSASSRFGNRMDIFRERGFHTLVMDTRGHGASSSTFEWTAGKIIDDFKEIMEILDRSKINNVHLYGHSLGGFVTLGIQNKRHDGWWKGKISSVILESPMTAYSPILKEMSGKFSFLEPYMKKLALNGFKKIHPEVSDLKWEDIDVPNWGLPKCPTLLLQAENDTRLGREHYDLLMNCDIDIEAHLISSLTHSRNNINEERDNLIIDWIENPRY